MCQLVARVASAVWWWGGKEKLTAKLPDTKKRSPAFWEMRRKAHLWWIHTGSRAAFAKRLWLRLASAPVQTHRDRLAVYWRSRLVFWDLRLATLFYNLKSGLIHKPNPKFSYFRTLKIFLQAVCTHYEFKQGKKETWTHKACLPFPRLHPQAKPSWHALLNL